LLFVIERYSGYGRPCEEVERWQAVEAAEAIEAVDEVVCSR